MGTWRFYSISMFLITEATGYDTDTVSANLHAQPNTTMRHLNRNKIFIYT